MMFGRIIISTLMISFLIAVPVARAQDVTAPVIEAAPAADATPVQTPAPITAPTPTSAETPPVANTVVEQLPANAIPVVAENADQKAIDISAHKIRISPSGVNLTEIGSLLFTPWQQALMEEARRGSGVIKSGGTKKNEILGLGAPEAAKPKDPGIRRISLGGIIYESSSKWTVWLNGTRITPKKLPKQAKSFVVYKDHIEMTWHDPYTEQTFPIRLRPQQTFDLDTRLFSDRTGE